MGPQQQIDGEPEEWLRRIALSRSLALVPDRIAVALIALGFARRSDDGSLTVTDAGATHLRERGIPLSERRRDRT
jgi:hypothetical protein